MAAGNVPEGSFDPYHVWLGIPPAEQPPHHYRLLGLSPFEDDPHVIEMAADRAMAALRSHQLGRRGRDSQRLLNEVAAARLCLLEPAARAAYDAQLRRRLAPLPAAQPMSARPAPMAAPLVAPPLPAAPVRASAAAVRPVAVVAAPAAPQPVVKHVRSSAPAAQSMPESAGPAFPLRAALVGAGAVLVAAAVLLALGAVGVQLLSPSKPTPVNKSRVRDTGLAPAPPVVGAKSLASVPIAPSVQPALPAAANPRAANPPEPSPGDAAPLAAIRPPPTPPHPAPQPETAPPPLPKPVPSANPLAAWTLSAVALPALEDDSATAALAPVALGPVDLPAGGLLRLELRGGDRLLRGGNQRLELAPAGTAAHQWLARHDNGQGASQDIARFDLQEGRLWFAWLEEARSLPQASLLRNCALVLSAGAYRRFTALRQPIEAPEFVWSLAAARTQANWKIEDAPPPEFLRVELQPPANWPVRTQLESTRIAADAGQTKLMLGDATPQQFLGSLLETKWSGQSLTLSAQSSFQLPVMPKPQPYTKRRLEQDLRQAAAMLQQMNAALQQTAKLPAGNPAADQLKQALAARLPEAETALRQLEQFQQTVASVPDDMPLQVRVYFQADDQTPVELLRAGAGK